MNRLIIILLLFLSCCCFSQEAPANEGKSPEDETIKLNADSATLEDCELIGRYIRKMNKEGSSAQWKVHIPKSGIYIVRLVFSVPQEYTGPIEFKSGDISVVWRSVGTEKGGKGWVTYKMGNVAVMDLKEGEQIFSIKTLQKAKGINVRAIHLVPHSGEDQVRFIGRIMDNLPTTQNPTPQVNRIDRNAIVLNSTDAIFKGDVKTKEYNGVACITGFTSNDSEAIWEVDIPKSGRYVVQLYYGAAIGRNGTIRLQFNKQSWSRAIASTRQWENLTKVNVEMVALEKGKCDVRIKQLQKDKDICLARIALIPVENVCVTPEKNGVIVLSPDTAILKGPGIRAASRRVNIITEFHEGDSEAQWFINVPQEGNYEVEIDYSSHSSFKGKSFNIKAGGRSNENKIVLTTKGGFRTGKFSPVKLPKGITAFAVNCNKTSALEIRQIRLTSSSSLRDLGKRSRIGMSVDQLSTLWGKSRTEWLPPNEFQKIVTKDGLDEKLYKKAQDSCVAYEWNFTQKRKGLSILGVFLNDQCVAMRLTSFMELTPKELREYLEMVVPSVPFNRIPDKEKNYTIYSSDPGKTIKLSKRGLTLDISSPRLIEQVMKSE